jgi:methionine-rich copper-binding protein CopC
MRLAFTSVVVASVLFSAGTASAHATLDHAEPGADSTVKTAPQEVSLSFTQKLEAAFSKISVTNASGQQVDTGKPHISGNQMAISLNPIGAGTYHVKWHVLSTDTHTTDGSFTFRIAP